MTSTMRRTVRGTAAGLGALAIIAGASACGSLLGGGGDEGGTGTTKEQPAEEDSAAAEEDSAAAEEGGEAAEEGGEAAEEGASAEESGAADESATEEDTSAEETTTDAAAEGDDAAAGAALSEEDLTAVGDAYYAFVQAAATSDGKAACGLVTNPNTGNPLEGSEIEACAEGFEGEADKSEIDPSMADALDRSMIEGVDNGDGTAGVTLMGSDAGVTFVKADDGKWYIDGSEFV